MTRGLLHDYNIRALRSDCIVFAASVAQDMYNIQIYRGGRRISTHSWRKIATKSET